MSKPSSDLIEPCFHNEVDRREFCTRIMKIGVSGLIVSLNPSALITKALAASAPEQNKWQPCRRCNSLFYNGYRNKGLCPGGGAHVPDDLYDFFLTYDSPGPGQRDWRFCNKCESLFFDGYSNKGVCKGGGGHVAAGFNFTLRYDARANGRSGWRFCNKCETLFASYTDHKGICAAGSAHGPGGFDHFAAGYNFVLDDKRPVYTM